MALAGDTLLVLAGVGTPPYSARGLTQTYEPIAASIHLERSVNGDLVDLSAPQMRKYASKITCTDQTAPAFAGAWPGDILVVDCVFELSFLTANAAGLERPIVPGTVRTQGDFTFYRPRLTMVVMNYNSSLDEWGASVAWELDLEER